MKLFSVNFKVGRDIILKKFTKSVKSLLIIHKNNYINLYSMYTEEEIEDAINSIYYIDDAFYAENGQSVSDMNEAKLELQKDVVAIKNELSRLHEAFMVDIDEVNAELEYNFGWPIFGHVHGTQVTEDVED